MRRSPPSIRAAALLASLLSPLVPQVSAAQSGGGAVESSLRAPAAELQLSAGAGASRDTASGGSAAHLEASLALHWKLSPRWVLAFDTAAVSYRRQYLSTDLDLSGRDFARAILDENKLGVGAALLYDFDLGDRPWQFQAGAGGAGRLFHNGALPSALYGPAAAAAVGLRVAPELRLKLSSVLAYNLAPPAVSPMLAPVHPSWLIAGQLSLAMELAPRAGVSLSYRGEGMAQPLSFRLFHTLSLSLDLKLG